MSKRKKVSKATIAIEVTNSDLILVRVDSDKKDEIRLIHSKCIRWRDKSHNLLSDLGRRELEAGFQALVEGENLEGCRVRLALGGNYCVTRVVAGTAERIKHELDEITERSEHYIALGTGQKTITTHIRQLDARNQHALCVVANRKNLELIVQTATKAGVQVELVEPSLVALCRCLGRKGCDTKRPVLILDLGDQASAIGISHQGNLILDYRPGGQHLQDVEDKMILRDLVQKVANHKARLQRYCERFYRFTSGELNDLYLCGSSEDDLETQQKSLSNDRLRVNVLDATTIDPQLKFTDSGSKPFCSAALGSCLLPAQSDASLYELNLLSTLQTSEEFDFSKQLIKSCWPLIAASLMGISLWSMKMYQDVEVRRLEHEVGKLQTQESQVRDLKHGIVSAESKIKHLTNVKFALTNPQWNELLSRVAMSLPESVWIKNIISTANGKIKIDGSSFSENAIFETVRHLQAIPEFSKVELEGTRAGRYHKAVVFDFQLLCEFREKEKSITKEQVK